MNNIEIKVLKIIRIIEISISLKVKASVKISTTLNSSVETNVYFRNHLTSVRPCPPCVSSISSRVEVNCNNRGRI